MEKTTTVRVTFRVVDRFGFVIYENESFTLAMVEAEKDSAHRLQQVTIKNIPVR